MNKSKCGQNGLLHWQITREEYERLDESYKNCGIVFFVKENKDSNTGVIIRNGIQFAGGNGSSGDVDWEQIQYLITHTIGQQIDELKEELHNSMETMKNNIIEELKGYIDEQLKNVVQSNQIDWLERVTKEEYEALEEKKEEYLYVIYP